MAFVGSTRKDWIFSCYTYVVSNGSGVQVWLETKGSLYKEKIAINTVHYDWEDGSV